MTGVSAQDQYLECIDSACSHLDGIEEYGIATGDAGGLLVLHGLAMYARDVARAAVALLRAGQTLPAGALTRVVIEHAVLGQWLLEDPEPRGSLFLQQSQVEQYRWYQVLEAAEFELSGTSRAERQAGRPKNVSPEFDTPKNLFGDTDMGRQLYLACRNLSRFVHPAATTFTRYSEETTHGLLLTARLRLDQDPEALAYYLACGTMMCVLPYLAVLGGDQAAMSLRNAAADAGVVTELG